KSTRCADGSYAAECYVTGIDWNGQAEVEPQKALVRGRIVRKADPRFGALGLFRVTEVWQAAGDNRPVGSFFRVRDLHVRCVAAPCLAQQESRLNATVSVKIAGVDLSGSGASEELTSQAMAAMQQAEGLIVAGDHTPVTGPAGRSESLKATQFYLPAKKRGDETSSRKPCKKEGCSGQVCA